MVNRQLLVRNHSYPFAKVCAHLCSFASVPGEEILMKVVNVTPTASAQNLRTLLETEASARGKPMRAFVGQIYAYAVNNQGEFAGPLKPPKPKPGEHIGATVSDATAKQLERWAKQEQTSRGMLCCYILEKALQNDLLARVFGDGKRQ